MDGRQFDKAMPHSAESEQVILGCVLLDNATMHQAAESLEVDDFYSPLNRRVFAAMLTLFSALKPIDPILIGEELEKEGSIDSIGGVTTITNLTFGLPHFSNLDEYIGIVRKKSFMRKLIRACGAISGDAFAEDDEAEAVLTRAQNLINDLCLTAESGNSDEHFVPLRKVIENDVMQALSDLRHGVSTKLKTGFTGIDIAIGGGVALSDVVLVAADTGKGKALALDTPIPTPTGWTTMGEIQIGDKVFSEDGQICRVVNATPVMNGHKCFSVVFSDGTKIIADADHQWLTSSARSRISQSRAAMYRDELGGLRKYGVDQTHKRAFPSVVTTAEIASAVRCKPNNRLNHSIAVTKPLGLSSKSHLLEVSPYVLGAWLGDGKSSDGRLYSADSEVIDAIRDLGYEVRENRGAYAFSIIGLKIQLRSIGVLDNKHIPKYYLRASFDERLALLQGLMDTDGHCDKNGKMEFTTTSEILATQVLELVRTLGIKATSRIGKATLNGNVISDKWRICFSTEISVFRLSRKADWQKAQTRRRGINETIYITEVTEIPSVPVRCIEVNSTSHLFLVSESFIATHNSAFALQMAYNFAAQGIPSAFLAGEMTNKENVMRMLSQLSGITNLNWKTHISETEYRELTDWAQHIIDSPIHFEHRISDMQTLATHLRSVVRRHKVKVLVIDYIQLFKMEKLDKRKRNERIAEASQEVKRLANELNIGIIEVAQFNREGAKSAQAGLHDLEGSGQLEKDASLIFILELGETETIGERGRKYLDAKIRVVKGRNVGKSEVIGKFYGQSIQFEFD